MSYVFRRSQIRLKHHRHMFPFILAITCMLLVQFYSIIVARKWRQEYITYCTELLNTYFHIMIQYIGSLILKVITMKVIVFFWSAFKSARAKHAKGKGGLLSFSPVRARVLPSFLKNTGTCSTLSKTLSYTCIPKQMSKSLPAETAKQYG